VGCRTGSFWGRSGSMSQRSHFWLRIIGIGVILALEFGPRLWTGSAMAPATRVVAAATTSH